MFIYYQYRKQCSLIGRVPKNTEITEKQHIYQLLFSFSIKCNCVRLREPDQLKIVRRTILDDFFNLV